MERSGINMGKTRILIVDDQTLMRDGLKTILELEKDFEIVGCATDGLDAFEKVAVLKPDVVLMDIRMPKVDGVLSTKMIKDKYKRVKVIILTTFDDDEYIIDALSFGASGYLLKDLPADKLIQSVRDAANDNMIIPASIASKLVARISKDKEKYEFSRKTEREIENEESYLTDELSEREKEIAELLVKGLTNKEIATNLFLSEGTVKNYVSNIYSKIGTHTRAQAAVYLKDVIYPRKIF